MYWPAIRTLIQLGIALAIVLAWQFLPTIPLLSTHIKFLDRFYISSPTDTWQNLVNISTGRHTNGITVWPYLGTTIYSTLVGTSIGLVLGGLCGLIFSNGQRLSEVIRPFIVLSNSVPRVALIPIFVVLVGPSATASIISVIAVVFFLGFFNAFEGGRSIPEPVLENATLLGASPFEIMRSIRLPRVLTWTFAAVPNAISFGIIVSVTTELLAGVPGMGTLLQTSTINIQAGLTFAIIVVLSVVGLILYWGAIALRNRVIHWENY
jgi:NitT/TauT family transport system permease protein